MTFEEMNENDSFSDPLWVFFWNGWKQGVRSTGRDLYDINLAFLKFEECMAEQPEDFRVKNEKREKAK